MLPWFLRADHKIELRKTQTTEKWNPDFSYRNGSYIILHGKTATHYANYPHQTMSNKLLQEY